MKQHSNHGLSGDLSKRTWSLKLWIILCALLSVNIYLASVSFKGQEHASDALFNVAADPNKTKTTLPSIPIGELPLGGMLHGSTKKILLDGHTKKATKHKQLNVMIFYPDDWRHDTIGAAGTQPVKTPFLDQLSREGIRFTHNCVTTSICWISRATLLTGQYLSRHKSQFLRRPTFYERWNETFPYTLQENGYFVGHIGKWQFDGKSGFIDRQYNWSHFYEGSHWYYNKGGTKTHSTVRDEQEAIRFLRERPKDTPFLLTTAFYAPKAVGQGTVQHNPMDESEHLYENVTIPLPIDPEWAFTQLPQFMQDNWYYLEARRRYKQRFDFNVSGMYETFQRRYYRMVRIFGCFSIRRGCFLDVPLFTVKELTHSHPFIERFDHTTLQVSEVDEAIKKVCAELEAQGILDETLIIFTTDNGLYHAEHGLAGKWFPHEESIRIPLIIRDPRMSKDVIGTLDDSFTLNIDLAATILGAAGLPPNPRMQGRNIADLYLTPDAKATWRDEFYYEHPSMGFKKGIPESSALVRKNYKYIRWPEYDYEQLFDMKKDPHEHADIAQRKEYAELLAEMRSRHDELKASVK